VIAFLAGMATMGGFFYCAMEWWTYALMCFTFSLWLILLAEKRHRNRYCEGYRDGYDAGAVQPPGGPVGLTTAQRMDRRSFGQIEEFRKAYIRQLSDVEGQLMDTPRVRRDGFTVYDPDDLLGLDAIEEGQYH